MTVAKRAAMATAAKRARVAEKVVAPAATG